MLPDGRRSAQRYRRARGMQEEEQDGDADDTKINARASAMCRQRKDDSWWDAIRKQGDESRSAMRDWVWTNVGVPLQEKVRDVKINMKAAMRNAVVEMNKLVENTAETLVEGHTANSPARSGRRRLEDVNIWEEFFGLMLTCVDLSLCEGWLVPEDVNEPFFQLGMPAAAVAEISLRSQGSSCTEIGSATVTPEDLMLEEFEEIRDLLEQVQKVKDEIVKVRPNREEEEFIRRSAICAGGKEVPANLTAVGDNACPLVLCFDEHDNRVGEVSSTPCWPVFR
eukprot:544175-Hanusia_phi.AAC.1